MCILPADGYTPISIRKDVVQTRKALMVVPKKQRLPNGMTIPNGKEMWLKNYDISQIKGGGKVDIPNWQLNEIIRTINLDNIRAGT